MRRAIAMLILPSLLFGACHRHERKVSYQGKPLAVAEPQVKLELRSLPRDATRYPLASAVELEPWKLQKGNRQAPDGALLRDYGGGYGGAGWQFTPVVSGSYCTSAYNAHLDGNRRAAGEVLAQADALLARAERAGDGIVWRYRFPNRAFSARPGWISGMGQGLALGCLAAAYSLSKEPKFLRAAHAAFVTLRSPFGSRGTAARVRGGVFYEEVAGGGSHPSHILNGMIFSLAGVAFLNRVAPRSDYHAALVEGIDGLRANLDRFFVAGWTLYSLSPLRKAPKKYHVLHGEQFVWLYRITGDVRFLRAALRIMKAPLAAGFPVATSEYGAPQRTIAMFDTDLGTRWTGRRRGSWLVADARNGLTIAWCREHSIRPIVLRSADLRSWDPASPLTGSFLAANPTKPFAALVWPSGGGCVAEMARGRVSTA